MTLSIASSSCILFFICVGRDIQLQNTTTSPQDPPNCSFTECWNLTKSQKFLLVGDTGKNSSIRQTVKEIMNNFSVDIKENIHGLLLGDNFYPSGIDNKTKSTELKTHFLEVFNKNLNFTWYAILGNHDYMGDIASQINISETNDSSNNSGTFYMPSNYYSKDINISGVTIKLVFIDSEELLLNPFWKFYGLPTNKQYDWIVGELKNSSYFDYLFVVGHHPIYSAGPHLICPYFKNMMESLLESNNVTAYICGHNHNLAYFKKSNISYIISGAGSKQDSVGTVTNQDDIFKFSYSGKGGFVTIEANKTIAYVRFIGDNGSILFTDQFSIRKTA